MEGEKTVNLTVTMDELSMINDAICTRIASLKVDLENSPMSQAHWIETEIAEMKALYEKIG